MHISPKTLTCWCGRTPWLRSLPREFSAGCLLRVMRLQAYSNAQRFACVCAVAYWRHLLIFCDSLFLPRKKIGNKALRRAGTAFSMRCAIHIGSYVNTAAGTNSECMPLG